MKLIVFAVPPVVTAVMFIAKKLAGFLGLLTVPQRGRFCASSLCLFSLIGILSTSIITGAPIDADRVSNLVKIALETAVSGSHSLYVWCAGCQTKRSTPPVE